MTGVAADIRNSLSHAAEQNECAAQNDNAVDPVAFQFNRSKRVRQTVNKAITFGVAFPILGGATSAVKREAGASLQGSVLLNPILLLDFTISFI